MAYDMKLAARVRAALLAEGAVDEIKMFGGVCYKVDGHMACGVLEDCLIVKCDRADHEALRARPHTKDFDFTGRRVRGILLVKPAGVKTPASLRKWLNEGIASAKAQAKSPGQKRRRIRKSPRP